MSVWVGVPGGSDPALTARVTALEDTIYVYEVYESIAAGTTGTITAPTGSTILLDRYQGAADAIICKITSGVPDDEPVVTAAGVLVTTTFDASGNWVLSGTPSAYPVAIVYQISIPGKYIGNIPVANILDKTEQLPMYYGTTTPPATTGLRDGSVYFKYTP